MPTPFVSANVHYRLSTQDISPIGDLEAPYQEGDIVAAVISRVNDADPEGTGDCDLRLFPAVHKIVPLVQAVLRGDDPGQWDWPPA